ncbi:4-coumarate--CoA ligase-like 3 [Capsicum annuum]|uniref:4-coumarate--CoA ligase n=1 Tax=Capsicum annuum TaxID=4072 RepID=A0A1U8GK96_CAPAN|nr:4-coumarate--CoA ligase-like 6 [Capsicum annuum]KAF3654315.1 4-coumarate--CoA ligase-like 3 [Capsicum annuum]KAF3674340.1 4-coumarate--CoA ligase-like 3 [Capsicum annuum]PHT93086.1 4-coumarate--CoA ligase-like 3 [Capsicum annuum]
MTTFLKPHFNSNSTEGEKKGGNGEVERNPSKIHWYCAETGVYTSKHPSVKLPEDPFLDVVSFIFSHKHGGVCALVDSISGISVSYEELYPMVKSMASGLHKRGVVKGDVVLILLPNSIYFPVVLLGALIIGAVVTTMNPLSSLLEIKKQVLDCGVSLVFTCSDKVDKLCTLDVPVIGVPEILVSGSNGGESSVFYELVTCHPNWDLRPRISQQDTAVILYSSGTTGASKGVVLTHGNLIAMVELFVRFESSQYEYLSTENVYLAIAPMFHVYGLSLFAMGLLSLGTTIVVMRKFDANEMVKAIETYGVTHFPAVPPLLIALTRKAKDGASSKLKSLKQVSCGAAPITTKTIEDFVHTLPNVDFIQGYGMTESTAVGTRGYNTEKLHNYSSVGLLAPNMQAKVVDWITGSPLPPNSMGELWLCGPGVMKGYLNNLECTKSTIDDNGWLHSGDIAYFDEEGYLYVIDRLKETIKYKGFQIAPADLESVLVSHPDIIDAAVIGARDEEAGEIPVAFVAKRDGCALSQTDVIDFVSKQVAPYKKIRKVYFGAWIPRSAAGKILRKELRNFLTSKL